MANAMETNGCVALRYLGPNDEPTQRYPFNPNGSPGKSSLPTCSFLKSREFHYLEIKIFVQSVLFISHNFHLHAYQLSKCVPIVLPLVLHPQQ